MREAALHISMQGFHALERALGHSLPGGGEAMHVQEGRLLAAPLPDIFTERANAPFGMAKGVEIGA